MKGYTILIMLLLMISINLKGNNYTDSIYYVTSQKLKTELSDSAKADLLSATAKQLADKGYNDLAYVYINQALVLAQHANYLKRIASIYNIIGIIKYNNANYDEAIKYYLKALEIHQKTNNKLGVSCIYNNIGSIHSMTGNYKKAIEYLNCAKYLFYELKDTSRLINSLVNLGTTFIKTKEYKKAEENFNQSLFLAEKQQDKTAISIIYREYSDFYIQIGEYDKAIHLSTLSLKINREINSIWGEAWDLGNLGGCYLFKNEYDKALEYLLEAEKISKKINNGELSKNITDYLYRVYASKKDFEKAFEYCKQFQDYNDSIKSKQVNDIQNLLNSSYNEREIEQLNHQKTLKDAQIRLTGIILIATFTALLLLLILYLLNIRKLKAYRIIVRKNLEIVKNEKLLEEIKEKESAENISIDLKAANEKVNSENISQKYTSSNLSDDKKTDIIEKLSYKIEKEKIFLHPDIKMKNLAEEINTNNLYLSQTINEYYGQSFSDFINERRVKEARKLLSDPAFANYTIEHIAKMVGFKSKSSFNIAFKKYIGVTPSFYMKSAMENIKSETL